MLFRFLLAGYYFDQILGQKWSDLVRFSGQNGQIVSQILEFAQFSFISAYNRNFIAILSLILGFSDSNSRLNRKMELLIKKMCWSCRFTAVRSLSARSFVTLFVQIFVRTNFRARPRFARNCAKISTEFFKPCGRCAKINPRENF